MVKEHENKIHRDKENFSYCETNDSQQVGQYHVFIYELFPI